MHVILYRLRKPTSIGERALKPDVAGSYAYVAVPATSVPFAVRIFFLFFIFTLPYEAIDLGSLTGAVSLARISGLLFFACYFFYHNPFFGRVSFPRIPGAMWWFVGYFAIFALQLLFVPETFAGTQFTL